MYFRWTAFNGYTLFIAALTIWMIVARAQRVLDSSWPLVYYSGIIVYARIFRGALNPYWILMGLVCGLLLRFEFLGEIPLRFVRILEIFFFAYLLWRSLQLVLLWPW